MQLKLSIIVLILSTCFAQNCLLVSASAYSENDTSSSLFTQGYIIPCYFTNWAQYRYGGFDFRAVDVDPSICSHIIFAFYDIKDKVVVSTQWNDESELNTLVGYKTQYPNLKIMVAVGGKDAESKEFSDMVQTPADRQTFIDSLIDLVRSRSLDGIEINWQYPSTGCGRPSDRQLYTTLLQEMRVAFDAEGDGWLVSSAQGTREELIDQSYEIEEIASVVDFLNLMTYDFHGSWNSNTGIHSNLYGTEEDIPTLNVNWAVNAYVNAGAPANKLVIGMSSSGNSFNLCGVHLTNPNDPACGSGTMGSITRELGILAYYEICISKQSGWTAVYDDTRIGEYAYSDSDWVGYDTIQSIETKCDYIKDRGLAGGFLWDISMDDFWNMCSEGHHPLLTTLYTCLMEKPSETTTVPPSTPTAPTLPPSPTEYVVVCHFPSWAQHRDGGWDFRASNVDPSLCTHIIFQHYKVQNSRLVNIELNDEDQLRTLSGYKTLYPTLKIMLAVGGWNAGSVEFSNMVHSTFGRQTFINDCVVLMQRLNLDGIEIDWQYPAARGGISSDKQMYTVLLREMRQGFDAQNRNWLLTASQVCGEDKIYSSYEIAEIAREVDFLNLLTCYASMQLSIHSKLYRIEGDRHMPINWMVNAYVLQGAPANKLVIGMSSHGISSRLCFSNLNYPNDPSCGYGSMGPITREPGTLAYFEICMSKQSGWTSVYDDYRVGEYAYSDSDWVGYDTVQSIETKCDYIKDLGLAGGCLVDLSLDDFRNMCGEGIHPLLEALNSCLLQN